MDTRHRDDAVTDPGAIGAGGVGATVEATSPDAAVFSVAPVSGRRRRFPVAAAAVLGVGVLGIAVAGTLGRTQPLLKTPVIAKGPVAIGIPDVRSQSQRLAEGPFGPLDGRTGVTPGRTGPALITVEANRSGGLVFVHGDVFTRQAVGVLIAVTVADGRDRTTVLQYLELPGGTTAFRLGPNDRFDLSVQLPKAPGMQAATITANAYDDAGSVVATARTRLGEFAIEAPALYRT